MELYREFKLVKNDGTTAIILHKNRILLAKRIYLPFITDAGLWTFVAGHRKTGERHNENAYREIFEETGISRKDLVLMAKYKNVMKVNVKRREKNHNSLYVFRAKTKRVTLNIENTQHRWATFSDIKNQKKYTNIFADEGFILGVIRKALQK